MAKNTTSMNKKALSDVITNVLIILLVIVAVGIIAAFIMPLLRNTGTQVTEGTGCLSVNVEIASCTYNSTGGSGVADGKNFTRLVINRGPGSYGIDSVKYILEKDDGTTNITSFTTADLASFTEFASVVKNLTPNKVIPKSAGVAVTMAGAKNSCPESPRVTCTPYK
ncbi:MAG: hypothetical protein Q7R87_05000 [Nanoarchaeota archaeon]|nr:hypothetical protein [Nanoarchaeota archaeon]